MPTLKQPRAIPGSPEKISDPAKQAGPTRPQRPWSVTVLGLLLLIESVGLAVIGVFHIVPIAENWLFDAGLFVHYLPIFLRAAAFIALAILGLLSASGFFRVLPITWLTALMIQGLALLMSLVYYFRDRPIYIFPLMAFGIFMVAYLNLSEVLQAFDAKKSVNV